MTQPINEGLRFEDLKGMVQNRLSVDEYQSKIDETAIVFAFYVADKHAAEDTNRFLQKSYVELLDTEVSAAPDQEGNYLVFVEMPMNDKTAKAASQLCDDLGSLAAIKKWVVEVRGSEPTQPLAPQEIEQAIKATLHFSLEEFFYDSDLKNLTLNEGYWQAQSSSNRMIFKLEDFGSFEQVVARNRINESAVDLSPDAIRSCKHIRGMLGNSWAVEKVGDKFAVYQESADALVLLSYMTL